mgnify:CR=1 FL=1
MEIAQTNQEIVFKAIMLRYEGLTNCIAQLGEDADVVYVNIGEDINDVLEIYEIEEIINKIISY